MSVLRLDKKSLQKVLWEEGSIESGMDYVELNAIVDCASRNFSAVMHIVVRGNGFAAPLTAVDGLEDVYSGLTPEK